MLIFLLIDLLVCSGDRCIFISLSYVKVSLIPSIYLNKKIPVLFVFRKEIAQSIKDLENDPDLFKANNRVHIFLFRISGFFGIVFGLALLFFYFFM